MEGRLAEEIERTERLGEGFALLFADLDHFKAVNDEHGHVLGDDDLRLVARSLSENARQIDVVARYERAREDLLEHSWRKLGFPVRLSAGAVGSGSGKSAREILAADDGAMYKAKRRGKDGTFVPEG